MVLTNINRKMHQMSWKVIWRICIVQACCATGIYHIYTKVFITIRLIKIDIGLEVMK